LRGERAKAREAPGPKLTQDAAPGERWIAIDRASWDLGYAVLALCVRALAAALWSSLAAIKRTA